MGRHTGWIAASSALGCRGSNTPPHIVLLPEVHFNPEAFLAKVKSTVDENGYCVIVTSEGIQDQSGRFLADSGLKDAFGHSQLGGVAPVLANMVQTELGLKNHWAVSDYLQRAASHIASKTDVEQAYALGQAAVEQSLAGSNNVMMTIKRDNDSPYQWHVSQVELSTVANIEKTIPSHFIADNQMHVTQACIQYMQPLIEGESYPPYEGGLPMFARLKNELVEKKLHALI